MHVVNIQDWPAATMEGSHPQPRNNIQQQLPGCFLSVTFMGG